MAFETRSVWRLLISLLVPLALLQVTHASRLTLFDSTATALSDLEFDDLDSLLQAAMIERHGKLVIDYDDCVDGASQIFIHSVYAGSFSSFKSQQAVNFSLEPCFGARFEGSRWLWIAEQGSPLFVEHFGYIGGVADVDGDGLYELVVVGGGFGQGFLTQHFTLETLANNEPQVLADFGEIVDNCGYYGRFGTSQTMKVEYEPGERGQLPEFVVQTEEFGCEDLSPDTLRMLREQFESIQVDSAAMYEIARSGNEFSIEYLSFRVGSDGLAAWINQVDSAGVTPLMTAAAHNTAEMVQALVDAGADLHAVDARGWTALMFAERLNQDRRVLQTLQEAIEANRRPSTP